jgi:hypothetical protein
LILRAYFFDNNEEFGQNGVLGQPPSLIRFMALSSEAIFKIPATVSIQID